MSTRNLIRVVCATAIVAGCSATIVRAQLPDRRTLFSFSGPVAIPGATLPAGKYVFRLAEPSTSARVVQVFSADGMKPYGMFFSHPSERVDAPRNPEVRFMETARGMPSAIKTWWYPGDRTGYEFVYPKDQARKLAQGSNEPVLTTREQSSKTDRANTANLARVSPSGEETTVDSDSKIAPSSPTGSIQEGTVAAASIAFPSSRQSASADRNGAAPPQTGPVARASLPNTASNVPMLGLIGLIALASGALIRFWPSAGSPRSLR